MRAGRLAFVGRWADLAAADRRDVLDLGECLLLPGLINAHCHLDYTDMAGHIPPPKNFPDWIKAILAEKAACSYSDYARAWVRGAQQLVRNGTTTVADIEAVPELLPDVWDATPLRVHSFLEMTGVRSRRAPGSVLGEAVETIRALPDGPGRVGLSPHAA